MPLPKSGLTLIESITVAGILTLIVVFVIALVPTIKISNRRANLELQAGALAQSYLEQLRAVPFDSVASTTFPDTTIDGVTYRTRVLESGLISAGTPPLPISKTVRVEIDWRWREQPYSVFRQSVLCRIPRS